MNRRSAVKKRFMDAALVMVGGAFAYYREHSGPGFCKGKNANVSRKGAKKKDECGQDRPGDNQIRIRNKRRTWQFLGWRGGKPRVARRLDRDGLLSGGRRRTLR